jgi:hypothetical protein
VTARHPILGFSLPLILLALLASPALEAGAREQAKRIHDRLTGVGASNAVIDAMAATIDCSLPATPGFPCDPTGRNAARYAIDTAVNPQARYFYNVTLKNFATPWTNEEQTVFAPLNDYSATVIGLIRDGASRDFREILHGNIVYRGADSLGIAAYDNGDNDHYEQLEALGPITGDLSDDSILIADTQTAVSGLAAAATAGIMTSRAAAMAYFSDGTNRAMLRFTLMNHLCTDLEPLKDVTRTPDRVRRDVSRSPGGDSRIFMNNCVGCHAGMDGMAGAFARYEWDYANDKTDGHLEYNNLAHPKFDATTGVSLKHNINQNNFEYGYLTVDDSWINYWRNGPNSILGNRPTDSGSGWRHPGGADGIVLDARGNATGSGAKSLGVELANSRAFAQCQVDKAFEAVCLRDPNLLAADRAARDSFVGNFTGGGYNLREVFTDVAAYCKGN